MTEQPMTADVLAVYDLLASIVHQWRTLPRARATCGGEADGLLTQEARLLDDRRFDEWLDCWTADGALWVPLDPDSHPATDQSYYLDDVRRLRERVAWSGNASAWSQQPPLRVVRQLSNIESFAVDDGLHTRSVLTLHEQRGAARSTWPLHQLHVFDAARQLRAKVLLVPALAGPVPHPGALL